jgi:hypothetical protein
VYEPRSSHARRGGDVARPPHIDLLVQIGLPPAEVNMPGGMDDGVDAPAGDSHRCRIANVARHALHGQIGQRPGIARGTGQDADLGVGRQKLPHDVVAQEARGPCNEILHSLAQTAIPAPMRFRILSDMR